LSTIAKRKQVEKLRDHSILGGATNLDGWKDRHANNIQSAPNKPVRNAT